jgi:tRNA(fMet)-specific endonuclease VapC
MRYLLDTNIVLDLVRRPQGPIAQRIRQIGEGRVCTSIVVRFGAEKKGSERLTEQVEAVLGVLDVLPLEAPADAVYGVLRTRLERMGQPIGGNDLLIAAQTVALGYTLVTDNEREFMRIGELPVENWLR